MKRFYFLLSASLITLSGLAQTLVPRTPLYEVFSSSTCPPCKPANDHLSPIFASYEGEIAVVKYQMSWPGSGDPYYTAEGNSRRNNYGVNGVPAFFPNGTGMAYGSFTSANIDSDLLSGSGMKMDLRYLIDLDSQIVRIRARVEAVQDYTDGGQRLYIPIIEKLTTANKKSNGENEFHNVFKKMLPSPTGEMLIGAIDSGEVMDYSIDYTFNGDYRLPINAGDQIDHDNEHSVEEFDDLHVIMFMQSLVDKDVYQAAVGVREYSMDNLEREWGADLIEPVSIEELNAGRTFALIPNPANELVRLEFVDQPESGKVELFDISGALMHSQNVNSNEVSQAINVSHLPSGVYIAKVISGEVSSQQRIVIQH